MKTPLVSATSGVRNHQRMILHFLCAVVDQQLDASEVNIETKFNENVFIKIKSGLIIGNI